MVKHTFIAIPKPRTIGKNERYSKTIRAHNRRRPHAGFQRIFYDHERELCKDENKMSVEFMVDILLSSKRCDVGR